MEQRTLKELLNGNWHDACLYFGLMSEVNPLEWFTHVKSCQDRNGQLWRNPESAAAGNQYRNSCSRDMMIGLHLALASYPGIPAVGREVIIKHANYLRRHNFKLNPEASDNRNRVGGIGIAQVDSLLKKYKVSFVDRIKALGLKGFVIAQIFKLVMRPTMVLEAATVWDAYQLNLIMTAALMYRHLDGKDSRWTKYATYIMKQRYSSNHPCGLLSYIEGNYEAVARVERNVSDEGDIWPPSQFSQWLIQNRAMPLYRHYLQACLRKLKPGRVSG